MLVAFGTILENFGDFVLISTKSSLKSVIISAFFLQISLKKSQSVTVDIRLLDLITKDTLQAQKFFIKIDSIKNCKEYVKITAIKFF